MVWAAWELTAEEKALASSEMADVDAVVREGGQEMSSNVMPWKLEAKTEDPVVAAVSLRYFSVLYMKTVKSSQEDWVVCSSQSRSAMSNIPDFRIFSIAIRRVFYHKLRHYALQISGQRRAV